MDVMMRSQYGQPMIIRQESVDSFRRVSLSADASGRYDEAFVQRLIFEHPETLPIGEIDDAFAPLIPVCTELNTPAGPLDALFVTPSGRLVIVEAKLWRNPEARRKVIAQVLDYAKELARWSYEDLQREINRRLGTKGNQLFQIATASTGDEIIEESEFVDAVSRVLCRGRFMLVIAGDGIREGAAAIAEFLGAVGHLEFVLALVELGFYENNKLGLLVQPRVLARTVEIQRSIISVAEGMEIRTMKDSSAVEGSQSRDLVETRQYYTEFWDGFLQELTLDDQTQPLPAPAISTNLFFSLPSNDAWISAYLMKSKQRVGVYFRCSNNPAGRSIAKELMEDSESIQRELGTLPSWNHANAIPDVFVRMSFDDVQDEKNRQAIYQFFSEWINCFVNVFRPRIKRIMERSS